MTKHDFLTMIPFLTVNATGGKGGGVNYTRIIEAVLIAVFTAFWTSSQMTVKLEERAVAQKATIEELRTDFKAYAVMEQGELKEMNAKIDKSHDMLVDHLTGKRQGVK